MKSVAVAVFAMLMCSLVLAADKDKNKDKKTDAQHAAAVLAGEQKTISSQSKEMETAATRRDFDVLQRIMDPNATIVNSQGQVLTRAHWIENMRGGTAKYSSVARESEQVHVLPNGNTAVETGTLSAKGQENGHDISGRYAFTNVWANEDGRWQVISTQWTPVAAAK